MGGGGGVFGESAKPNFILPCEVIGGRVKNSFFVGGGAALVYPTSDVAARVAGGPGACFPRKILKCTVAQIPFPAFSGS